MDFGKITIRFIITMLIITSVFLTSCLNFDEIRDPEYTTPEREDFDGAKLTYVPNIDEVGIYNDFSDSFFWQIETASKELLTRIVAPYALGVDVDGYEIDEGIELFEGGIEPINNNKSDYHDEIILNQDIFDYEIIEGELHIIDSYEWKWGLDSENLEANEFLDLYINEYLQDMMAALIFSMQSIDLLDGENYTEFLDVRNLSSNDFEEYSRTLGIELAFTGFKVDTVGYLQDFIFEHVIGDPYSNEQVSRAELSELFKNYDQVVNSAVAYTLNNESRYDSTPLLKYADFSLMDFESVMVDEGYPLPTGPKRFNSIILMNNKSVLLDGIALVLEPNQNIEMEIYSLHNKIGEPVLEENIKTKAFASAESTGVLLDLGELFGGANLEPFNNNTENFDNPKLTLSNYNEYFITESLGSSRTGVYNDDSTDYIEIVFIIKESENLSELEYNLSLFGIGYDTN